MIAKNNKASSLLILGFLGTLAPFVQAQTATKVEVLDNHDDVMGNDLVVTINGKPKSITKLASKGWIAEGGHAILWSGYDGAGGFENEGQSLWRYDVKSGAQRRLAAEYFEIDSIREVKSASGKQAIVLCMSDGGLGAPHLAIVDPKRGIVWRHQMARLTAIRNGRLAVGTVTEEAINDQKTKYPKVTKMLYPNLNEVLKRPVITLRRFS